MTPSEPSRRALKDRDGQQDGSGATLEEWCPSPARIFEGMLSTTRLGVVPDWLQDAPADDPMNPAIAPETRSP